MRKKRIENNCTQTEGIPKDRLVRKRVSSLVPSPENLKLYRPIQPNDPEVIKLAASIKRNGCDPLVITADNRIVSGHRRHAALLLNGQKLVTCRILFGDN